MKKLGLIFVAMFFAACASPKPAVQTPASNPYAGRPDLLKEQAELVKLKKFGDSMMMKCKGALALVPDEEDEKSEAKRDIYRVTAFNFCAERFEDFVKVADATIPKLHGNYLEAAVLWKQMAVSFHRLSKLAVMCAQAPKERKAMCQNALNVRQLIAGVLAFVAKEFHEGLIPSEDGDGEKSKPKKK